MISIGGGASCFRLMSGAPVPNHRIMGAGRASRRGKAMSEIDPVKWLKNWVSIHQQICQDEGHTPTGSYSLAEMRMCKKTLDTIEALEAENKRLREADMFWDASDVEYPVEDWEDFCFDAGPSEICHFLVARSLGSKYGVWIIDESNQERPSAECHLFGTEAEAIEALKEKNKDE